MKLYEIDEKRFKFDALKKFLTRVAGGSNKLDKARDLELDLSDTGDRQETGRLEPQQIKDTAGKELQRIYKDFNVDETEVFSIFKGEANFNTKAFNSSGAVGLFQVIPDTAKRLGVTISQIFDMTAAEQIDLYHKYLSMWTKKGTNLRGRLGMMQAAPAYASWKDDKVVYSKDDEDPKKRAA